MGNKKVIIITAIVFLLAGTVLAIKINKSQNTKIIDGKKLYLVKDFHYVEPGQVTCDAIIPECGYCSGKVINKKCYE